MSVPSNWFTSITIQNLFSFCLPESTDSILEKKIVQFRKMQDTLNAIASQKPVGQSNLHDCFLQLLTTSKELSAPKSSDEIYHLCRINLALYMLYFNLQGLPGKESSQKFLETAIQYLEKLSNKSEEMWWYFACALYYQALHENVFNLTLINKVIKCIKNIDSIHHKQTLAYFIHQVYYPQLAEYPDYTPLRRLEELLPSSTPYKLDGHCALLRHKYVQARLLENKAFFNVQQSSLLQRTDKPTQKVLTLTISKETSIFLSELSVQISVNQYDLFQFSAHIVSPTPPMLKIETKELQASNTTKEFEIVLRKRLRTAGFCNGEGFLKIDKICRNFDEFRLNIFEELTRFYHDKNIYRFPDEKSKLQYQKVFNTTFRLDTVEPELKKIDAVRKTLSGFNGINAVFLLHNSLINHPFGLQPPLLDNVKNLVRDCLEILIHASKASQLNHLEKHNQWLKLAKDCVHSLIQRPRDLLIQVGTPIKEGELYSTHAFYVAVRYLPTTLQFQVVITNGGSAVQRFHVPSPTQHQKDRNEYSYAAFEPFDLRQSAEALTHYLYLLISLEYRASIKEDPNNVDNPDTYENLLKSVYLRESDNTDQKTESFIGFQYEEFKTFKRQDLRETFLCQFTGNCTIHNLKKSLQLLFNMDQLTFGLFEDNLVLGFDQLLSTTLSPQSTSTIPVPSTFLLTDYNKKTETSIDTTASLDPAQTKISKPTSK